MTVTLTARTCPTSLAVVRVDVFGPILRAYTALSLFQRTRSAQRNSFDVVLDGAYEPVGDVTATKTAVRTIATRKAVPSGTSAPVEISDAAMEIALVCPACVMAPRTASTVRTKTPTRPVWLGWRHAARTAFRVSTFVWPPPRDTSVLARKAIAKGATVGLALTSTSARLAILRANSTCTTGPAKAPPSCTPAQMCRYAPSYVPTRCQASSAPVPVDIVSGRTSAGVRRCKDQRRSCSLQQAITLGKYLISLHYSMALFFYSVSLLDSSTEITSQEVNHESVFNTTSTNSKVSFDFLYSEKLIFWCNPRSKQIFSALVELNQKNLIFTTDHQSSSLSSLPLHHVRVIIESGLTKPTGLAVDWVNRRLFFADSGTSRIELCNLDGSMRKVLFHQFVHKPHSIVTHPSQSQIFWSDWGEPARIESAFMDGSSRQVIVSSLLSMPTGLAIDYPAEKLYWADMKQNMIECSNLDGSSRFIMVHEQVSSPISLSLFEDQLYWSSSSSERVHTVSKLTGSGVTTAAISAFALTEFDMAVKVFHSLRQPLVQSYPCQSHPCSHLCLPNNVSYRCACPFGHSFESNNQHKCQLNSSPLLLFTHRNDIRALTVSKDRFIMQSDVHYNDLNLAHILPIAHISFVVSFDYDLFSSTLFWADLVNKSIGRAKWTERQQENIVTTSLEAPSGIAFDWATGNLYWTDTGRNVIEVAKANGSFRSSVVWRSLEQPRDLVLDPVSAIMFWTQWSNHTANIERAGMDGSFRIILHSLNLTRPHGLALDHLYKRLYWADAGRSLIECSFYGKLECTFRRSILSFTFVLQMVLIAEL